ncbi:MAG: AAA family ATPase [Proteobacteria bacterium]|nr:AAA family ATPase [Pseudomonadota bacterium]
MEIPYLEYLGLSEKPFGLTPDTGFYFESETHKEALEHLKFFLGQREGIALIYGEVGSGKTILSRMFLNSLDKTLYNTALILNPIMDEEEFIKEIMGELGISWEDSSKKSLLDGLSNFFIEEHKKGKDTILVIDESQVLSRNLLELIRILSNIETEKEKILHTVLFAQTEFMDTLHEPDMKNLSQRITVVYKLKNFSQKETRAYINFRLYKAGSKGSLQFSDGAVDLIHNTSQGCPRLINMICDRCLLVLYSQSKNIVDEKTVENVINDESIIFLKQTGAGTKRSKKYFIPLGIIILLFLCLVFAFFYTDTIHKMMDYSRKKASQIKTAEISKTTNAISTPSKTSASSDPSYLISAEPGEYVLICEKDAKTIQLYKKGNSGFDLLKSFPCAIGKIHSYKQHYEDPSIPEGIFFFTKFISSDGLRPAYGYGAYVLNFPNLLNFKDGKKDGRIWLHGHSKNKGLSNDPENTKLGIAIGNDSLKEIHAIIRQNGAPFVIVRRIDYIDKVVRENIQREIESFLDSWKKSWESINTEKLLAHYSNDFLGNHRENLNAFKQIKEKVNKTKRFIRIDIEKPCIFLSPGFGETVAIVRFYQKYSSDNFSDGSLKVLYIQKKGAEWKIIGEDTL